MKTVLKTILAAVLIIFAGVFAWLGYEGKTQESALRAINTPAQGVTVDQSRPNIITFMPEGGTDTAVIFYPGGGVPCEAYAEIAEQLAIHNCACILADMPLNLVLLNPDAADSIINAFPEISHWYIAGHSLGAHFAQRYASMHSDQLDGLISMGAIIRFDFSESTLPVLSVTATRDGLCDERRLNSYSMPSPMVFTHHIIQGGCHRYFGSYSFQAGDGIPTITQQRQQAETVQSILQFIRKTRKSNA